MLRNWNHYPTPRDAAGNIIPLEHRKAGSAKPPFRG